MLYGEELHQAAVFLLPICPYMDVSYNQFQNLRKICRSVRLLLPCTEVQRATESLNELTVHCKLSSYTNSRKLICLPGSWVQNVHYKITFHQSYMTQPSHCSRFFHPNSIAWAVQTIKILTMQFCPLPCHLVAPRPKDSLQLPTLKHSQSSFFTQCERSSFTHIQNNRPKYSSVKLNL